DGVRDGDGAAVLVHGGHHGEAGLAVRTGDGDRGGRLLLHLRHVPDPYGRRRTFRRGARPLPGDDLEILDLLQRGVAAADLDGAALALLGEGARRQRGAARLERLGEGARVEAGRGQLPVVGDDGDLELLDPVHRDLADAVDVLE